jgi:lysophospholipase L1-like esterase
MTVTEWLGQSSNHWLTIENIQKVISMKSRLLIVVWLALWTLPLQAQEKSPSIRWEGDMKAFEATDKESSPPQGAVLFVGASGIKLWKTLAKDFPEYPVINRGFGGSQLADSLYFADRIVIPYKPRVIVLNAGGNDLNAGKSPEQVATDFQAFVEKVQPALPQTRIVFHSLAPSPARWAQADKQQRANQLIRDYIAKGKNLVYVDTFDAFLGTDGQPRTELYVADRLHHSPQGYKLRADLIRPHLKPE